MKVTLFQCLNTFPHRGVELKLHTHSKADIPDKPTVYVINRKTLYFPPPLICISKFSIVPLILLRVSYNYYNNISLFPSIGLAGRFWLLNVFSVRQELSFFSKYKQISKGQNLTAMSRIKFESLMVTLMIKKCPRFLWCMKVFSISPLEPHWSHSGVRLIQITTSHPNY